MADIQRYLNLITSQHANKPKFKNWLNFALTRIDNVTTLLSELYTYFDLDSAVGAQQDVLGDIIGVKRVVPFQPSDGSSPILDDETYLLVLQAKIAKNQWDGTIPQVYELFETLFPLQKLVINDNQDMTMSVLVFGMNPGIQQDLVANGYIVPKPQGVQINYSFPTDPVFAYDMDTDVFKGYDEGHWIEYF